MIPVTFSPKWICEIDAKLTLFNPLTQDQFEYDIKGIGEEPLAIEHLVINCEARKPAKKEIVLRNTSLDKQLIYRVETDISCASGPTSIKIDPQKKFTYTLVI